MLKKINSFLILLTALLCFGAANAWGETITVADGTTANQYHPIYGYYCDDASHHNQVLYTVSEFADLADMAGAQITKMKFYSSNASSSWGSLKVNIKLAEVSESALSGFNTTSALTSVYSGPISVSGTEMVIEFTDPFDYNGGNLLFDLTISAIGSYQQIKFYGVGTYDYIYSYKKDGDGSKSSYFVPKTTFTYEAPSSCAKPTDLTKGTITANSASFSWTAGGSESEWQYLCLPAVEEPDWSSASVKSTTASTVIVDGLEASTGYKFYVRANCGGTDGVSSVVSVAFKTACGAISTLPKTWNFDGIDDNAFPDCWQYITTSSTTPRVYNYGYYANSSPKSLYVYGGSASTPTTIIFPPFEADIKTLALSFYYQCSEDNPSWGYEYGHPYIGYITDPTDVSTFVALSTALDQKSGSDLFVDNFSLSGAPSGAYIAIQYKGNGYNGGLYLDDITVARASSCTKPTGIDGVSSLTPTSASVSWTGEASQYQYIVVAAGGAEDWTNPTLVSAKSVSLTGLAPNTSYDFYVRSYCSASEQSGSVKTTFRTPCGAVTSFPWPEDFTGMAEYITPECWDNSASTTSTLGTYPYYVWGTIEKSSNMMLQLYNGMVQSGTAVINTPLFTIPNETDYEFLFDYSHKANCGAFKVKVSVDGAPFAELGSYTNETGGNAAMPGEFIPVTISLASFANHTVQFQFYAEPNYGSGCIYIDNIKVQKAPTCFKPTGLGISNITSATADLAWTAGASETAWVVQYKAEGASDWTEKAVSATPSCTLTGLAASTTYYVQVKADCGAGDYSESCAQQTFKTTCAAESLPFVEDFGSTSAIPDCWNVGKTGGSYQWAPNYDTYPDYYLRFRTSSGSTYSYLQTPPIELTEDAQLTFDWRNSNNVTADLLISTDGGTTFTSIPNHGLSTTASSWVPKKFDLSAYTGETVVICFRGYNGTANRYLRIDNIRVDAKPCEALAAPTAAPTIDGGTISWTGNAKALRYQAVGASTWNTVAVTTTSYLLTGLEASTSYNVQVQAACATGDDDLWSNSLTFTTRCAATDELPYSNNFDAEESNELPACWSKISATDYPYVYSGAAAYGGSGKFLYFYGSAEQIAVLPALTADLSTLTFSLYYKGGSANFQLGYVKADGVTFVALETLPALTAFGAEPYELDLVSISAEAKYLAIRYSSTSNYASGYVDNVVVKKTPTCFKPASIAASAITANSATVAWTASGKGETQYQYVCVPAGETLDWTAATLTDELSATLTTLAPTTEYDFYVRSYCDTEDQSDAVKTSFTTKCAAAALPFDEDFDAVADYDMPECWNVYAATYYAAYVANGQLHADAPKTNATVIVLPELEASFVGASVAFNYSTSNGTLEVGYVTDAEDKNSFVAVSEALTAASTTQVLVPFTAGSGNIAFRFIGNTGDGDLYVDDIRIAHIEVFNDTEDNESRLAELATTGETIDVIFNRTMLFNGDYNTLCLPFSLSAAQLAESPIANFKIKAFDYASVENQELLIAITNASSIEAGVPYFVANQDNEPNQTVQLYKDVVITAYAPQSVDKGDVSFQGVINPVDLAAQNENDAHNQLFLAEGNTIYWPAQNKTVKGFRAYFNVTVNSGALKIKAGMPARIVERAEVPTGIEDVRGDVQSLKLIENGRVVILRNGVKYTIQGQVISK